MQCCRDHRKAEKTFEQRSESVIVHLETATHRSGEQNSSECTISTNSHLCSSISRPALPMPPQKPADENVPHATQPADERPHGVDLINPNDAARWLALADTALRQGASEENIAE